MFTVKAQDDGRVFLKLTTYLKEETIAELHDVGLVDGSHLSPVVQEGVAKGVLRHPPRALLRDDLQTLHNIRDNLVLQPTVLSLCVLPAHEANSFTKGKAAHVAQVFVVL